MTEDYPPIFYAAAAGDLERIREEGPHADPTDLNQALAEAASLSHFEAADLLLEFGADPKGLYDENYGTVLFPSCELLNPEGIEFLLKLGADATTVVTRFDGPRDALTHLLHSPHRSPLKVRCISILLRAQAADPDDAVMAIHRESLPRLKAALDKDPEAMTRPLEVDYGLYPLRNATLLHLAVEYNLPNIAQELIDRGLDVNTPAGEIPGTVDTEPIWPTTLVPLGKQSPLFHARGYAKEMLAFLLERGANPKQKGEFLKNGKIIQLTPQEFFQAIDDIECNLLEELLTLRAAD
ncbi:MAG: hypothetical protein JJU29_07550 [Verrucomicrobia bacterium]|nr:hypothetical protein [Verrucomicrobiota bacterium]MCH8511643.1 hypothetical protein [Kiritimatiellia bacterium]